MPAAASGTAMLTDGDREEVKGILVEFKNQYKQVVEEIAKLGKADSATLEKLDKLDTAMIEMRQKYDDAAKRADTLEVKLNEKRAEMEPPKSIGDLVVSDPGFIAHAKSGSRQPYTVTIPHGLHRKDIMNVSRSIADRIAEIAVGARLPTGVRTLVPQGSTTAGAVSYVAETSFTNNANVVAEGAAKPKSDKTFQIIVQAVETIAHYFKVSRQSYEDLPGLAAQIENNGLYGVALREDQQLLFGTGTSPQLRGFMTVASAAAAPAGTGATVVDAVGAAIFELANKGYLADGTVMNPADWGGVALMKSLQGNYLFANPLAYNQTLSIWGTRLVLSSQMTAANFLVGAFRGNSQILDREEVNVRVAESNEDDFIKNLLTVLVEERLALLIFRADAFLKGVTPAPAGLETESAKRR